MGTQLSPTTTTAAESGNSEPEIYLDRQIGVHVSQSDYEKIVRTSRELGLRPAVFARFAMIEYIRNREGGIKE